MKRLTLLLVTMGTALLLSAGVAVALDVNCLASRVCVGTDGPDTLNGSTGSDHMDARQNDDKLFGNERHDFMSGDALEADEARSFTDGNDILKAGPGFDELVGYGGDDEFSGGDNGDFILAEESSKNQGEDVVRGGSGNDFILARDGVKDTISCGKGNTDIVFFDKGGIDTTANNCEYKNKYLDFEEFSSAASSTPERVSAEKVNNLRSR